MYALLGEKLSHSYSKLIHNLFGTEYELKPVPPDGLEDFVKDASVQGFNVTIPYKQAIIPYLDGLDEVAKSIGAVNTVAKVNGRLIGYNTDCLGLEYTLGRSGISLCGAKVLILGSGGTSKTARYVAQKAKADEIIVVSRNGENNYSNLGKHSDADVIVNTTPVGMYPNCEALPVNPGLFGNLSAVADVIYNPLRTRLILAAREMGLKTATGLPMLVAQAGYAEEIWGKTIPDGETERIVGKIRRDTENVVLIGMPGCGKTSVGRELARLTGKKFVDTDEEIERIGGVPVPELVGR
ncbi:MAG: shikimate kinase, partial [Christensenellales bacterium]